MPSQGDLFIGVPVKDAAEAIQVFNKLQINIENQPSSEEEDIDPFDGRGGKRQIIYDGKTFDVHIYGINEEGTMAVAFNLTSRYRGAVIDIDCKNGRDDLFILDLSNISDLLDRVRAWWPEAQVFLLDIFY